MQPIVPTNQDIVPTAVVMTSPPPIVPLEQGQQQQPQRGHGNQGGGVGMPSMPNMQQMTAQASQFLKKIAPTPPSQPPPSSKSTGPLLISENPGNEADPTLVIGGKWIHFHIPSRYEFQWQKSVMCTQVLIQIDANVTLVKAFQESAFYCTEPIRGRRCRWLLASSNSEANPWFHQVLLRLHFTAGSFMRPRPTLLMTWQSHTVSDHFIPSQIIPSISSLTNSSPANLSPVKSSRWQFHPRPFHP